jgi:hypothetical protein
MIHSEKSKRNGIICLESPSNVAYIIAGHVKVALFLGDASDFVRMTRKPDAVVPGVQERHETGFGVAGVETHGEYFWVDEGYFARSGSVFVVVLVSVIVREIVALGDDTTGVELFEL